MSHVRLSCPGFRQSVQRSWSRVRTRFFLRMAFLPYVFRFTEHVVQKSLFGRAGFLPQSPQSPFATRRSLVALQSPIFHPPESTSSMRFFAVRTMRAASS